MKTLWVIMMNDFPESAALSKEAADQEVVRLTAQRTSGYRHGFRPPLHPCP